MPWISIARDLALCALAALCWAWDAAARAEPGPPSWAPAVAAAVMTGVCGFLLHEWGHLAATRLAGGRVFYPNRVLAPLLFHFDSSRNDRRQFLWMSAGGYLASVLGVALIAVLAPLGERSGALALTLAGLGLVATAVGEVPTTVRVARGAPLPGGYTFSPPPPPRSRADRSASPAA